MEKSCSLILYTTIYREGGPKFERAAKTKLREMQKTVKDVRCIKIESKAEFMQVFRSIKAEGLTVDDMHFFGHSGMYGIMFGSRQWPEQFSPFEWRSMQLPVAAHTNFYFHSCRSARWFAPFIARTLKINAHGYINYTTVSLNKDRFVWEGFGGKDSDLFVVACPGKKSHGMMASAIKYLGLMKTEKIGAYQAEQGEIDTSYDTVAELYEQTFEDIEVRSDELNWLEARIAPMKPKAVLDIGCGNGSFLNKLSTHFEKGVGVDASEGMLRQARAKMFTNPKLVGFHQIDGPRLPFPDNSFDVVTSTLAFRYLDWDHMTAEILRVLKPGGHFMVLDMVTAPVSFTEIPAFLISKLRYYKQQFFHRKYYKALRKLVTAKGWQQMLKYNPIRSEHEMRWYLESRFPGQKGEIINVGYRSRILAFDTGPVTVKEVSKLSYP